MIEAGLVPIEPPDMPDTKVLTDLLGTQGLGFGGSKWSNDPAVFRSNPEWFQRLSSLDVLNDCERWLDRATGAPLQMLHSDSHLKSRFRVELCPSFPLLYSAVIKAHEKEVSCRPCVRQKTLPLSIVQPRIHNHNFQ